LLTCTAGLSPGFRDGLHGSRIAGHCCYRLCRCCLRLCRGGGCCSSCDCIAATVDDLVGRRTGPHAPPSADLLVSRRAGIIVRGCRCRGSSSSVHYVRGAVGLAGSGHHSSAWHCCRRHRGGHHTGIVGSAAVVIAIGGSGVSNWHLSFTRPRGSRWRSGCRSMVACCFCWENNKLINHKFAFGARN